MLRRGHTTAERRLDRMERRLEDVEDSLAAALAPDRIDDLTLRVAELSLTAVTHDDLLRVRTEAARLAAEVTRVRAELHAELDQLNATLLGITDTRYPRRAG